MPTESKNLKVISVNTHFTSLDAVVEPNEEIQLDFAGRLPDENDKDVYILVGVDRFSRFPSAKVVTNNKADTIIRFMQTHIVNHGVPRNIRCDQAQGFRAKKFMLYCKDNNIKFIFAPVDDHRSIGMVEQLIRTLKARLSVMKIDNRNKPYKIASDVAELIKTLRVTPIATNKNNPIRSAIWQKTKHAAKQYSHISKIVKCVMGKHQTCLFRPKASKQTSTNRRSNGE